MIPKGWQEVRLGDVGKIVTGSTPSTKDPENYGSAYMFASPEDLGNFKYVIETKKMVSEKGFLAGRAVPVGSTLFVCIGSTIGKTAINKHEMITNQQINSLIPHAEFDNDFIYYVTSFASKKIKKIAGSQAVPLINKSTFGMQSIYAPTSKREQKRIAAILSTCDAVIATLEQLSTAKRQLKRALMQQLLTGKKRLPGCHEAWRRVRLGDVADVVMGQSPKGNTINESQTGTPLVGGAANLKNGKVITNKFTTAPTKICEVGDFIYCVRATIGNIGIADQKYCLGRGVAGIVPRINSDYLRHYLVASEKDIAKQATGSTFVQIDKRTIEASCVTLPPLAEQKRIAAILSACDTEIETLDKLTEARRQQKRGLMQQLLTGKVRV